MSRWINKTPVALGVACLCGAASAVAVADSTDVTPHNQIGTLGTPGAKVIKVTSAKLNGGRVDATIIVAKLPRKHTATAHSKPRYRVCFQVIVTSGAGKSGASCRDSVNSRLRKPIVRVEKKAGTSIVSAAIPSGTQDVRLVTADGTRRLIKLNRQMFRVAIDSKLTGKLQYGNRTVDLARL